MAAPANNETNLLDDIKGFAATHIAPRRHELISTRDFPDDLWQAFVKSGLAGLSLPTEYGGKNASYLTLSDAARCLNHIGGVPGVTMVFLSHWQLSKLHIAGDAPLALQQQLLPVLVDGATTLSVAISEPGAGAHPKHLKTTARQDNDMFVLNGEKTFLTNGPLANYFIVLAITGENQGQKEFSAILVPADSPGFSRTKGVSVDFLHPCPHGGILLDNCRVPTSNLIGTAGQAFIRTSLRMRAIEDAVGAAGQVGAMQCLLNDIVATKPVDLSTDIGKIATQLQTLDITARHLAGMADQVDDDVQALLELQLGFRQQSQVCSDMLAELIEQLPSAPAPEVALLARDISKHHAIASNAHAARLAKIGQRILKDEDRWKNM